MSASSEYMTRKQHVEELMKQLESSLKSHTTKASTDPFNWGFVGSLCHVEELLEQAVNFIGGGR